MFFVMKWEHHWVNDDWDDGDWYDTSGFYTKEEEAKSDMKVLKNKNPYSLYKLVKV